MNVTLDRVTKLYGPVIGLSEVSCTIEPGITCLFGSNGAGKSTLMKLASGQLRPSQGTVRIGRHDAWSTAAKAQFGYCPDARRFYDEMSGREFVETMAGLSGFSRRECRRRTQAALERVGMAERAERPIAGYSHGMRQRIKLAQALVHDPPVLLLDEPLLGIDPGGRAAMGEVLRAEAAAGKTILVSSHLLQEAEELTDRLLVLLRGRLVASGTVGEIRSALAGAQGTETDRPEAVRRPYTVEIVARPAAALAGRLIQSGVVEAVEVRDSVLTVRCLRPPELFAALALAATEGGIAIERYGVLDAGADAVFGYLERTG